MLLVMVLATSVVVLAAELLRVSSCVIISSRYLGLKFELIQLRQPKLAEIKLAES